MVPSQELFHLIKSLKQTEKRYFRVFAAKLSAGKEPEYLQLFNAIEGMAVYDEKKLKEKFKGKTFVKQLHVVKNYLTDAILQALVAYHDESSVNNDLLRMLQTIEILYNKQLHDLCFKQIEKGIKICETYSKQELLFLFLTWKSRILQRRMDYHQVLKAMEGQKQIIQSLTGYLNAKERAVKMHQYIVTRGFPRSEGERGALQAAHAGLISRSLTEQASMEEIYYHFIALSKYYAANDEAIKRVEPLAELVRVLESDKAYTLENPDIYISALGDYWLALVNTGQIKAAQGIFFKIRELAENLSPKKSDAKNYAFLVSYIFQLDISIYINETHLTMQLAPRIKEFIERAEGVHQKSTTLELIYNMYRVFFISGRYSDALDWVNLILNEQMPNIREDLKSSSRIFQLIIHYELGNGRLLQNIITSTKNSLKYKSRLFKAEKVLLEYLQKLNKAKSENEKQKIFQKLSDTFNAIYNDPGERKSTVDGDLLAWIESKLTGKNMGGILAEKYLKEVAEG